jgi:hypothetical protein
MPNMSRQHHATTALMGLLACTLLACAARHPNDPLNVGQPAGEPGILIASSQVVPGFTGANDATGLPDDCGGPGSGVLVEGTLGTTRMLYGPGAQPCAPAQLLFDGRTAAGQRPADPGLAITFHDSLGPLPNDPRGADVTGLPATLTPLAPIKLTSALITPTTAQIAEANQAYDPLVATLQTWQASDETLRSRSRQRAQEGDAAALRALSQLAKETGARQEADQLALVAAQLRERERQVEEEQRRHEESLDLSADNRAITAAARQAFQQREAELAQQLAEARARAAQFEQMNARLAAEKRNTTQTYQAQVQALSANLKTATQQAEIGRRELITQAAAKIAEAEALAMAARKQDQEIKLREAARLKAEAEVALDRALSMEAGRTVLADLAPAAAPAAPMQLGSVPVVLHAKNLTPEELVTQVLKLAEPQAGVWSADWQLSGAAQFLLKERWSLTAEAPVQQVLAQFAAQIRQTHGLTLTFTQFQQSRLLVITDSQGAENKQ